MDGDPTPALTGRRRTRPTSAGPGLLQSAAAIRGSLNPAGLHLSQRKLLFRRTEPPLAPPRNCASVKGKRAKVGRTALATGLDDNVSQDHQRKALNHICQWRTNMTAGSAEETS